MYEIEFTELALLDFEEAFLYYETQRPGLGDDLLLCFEEGLAVIKRTPHFAIRVDDVRAYNIHRFPYQILYRIKEDKIRVIGFFFGKRDPSVWLKRI